MTAFTGESAIDLRDVEKVYRGRVFALRGVSLRVNRGEVFGLLGPNGAGKSTLVKIMMSVVRPTRATGTLLGAPVGHKPTLARVGYLPENHRFPRYLTGRQVLEFFAALAKVDRATRRRRADELLEVVGMTRWAGTRIAAYSKGMLQRIGLAQALVHDPELVLLDEPTDGVDPVGRRDILDLLHRLRGRGKTVFINSHALSELEAICDRVAILVHGQMARQGTIDELTLARQRYEIEVAGDPVSAGESLRSAVPIDDGKWIDGLRVELSGAVLRVGTIDPDAVQGLIDLLRTRGLVIRRVQAVRPSLEELFLDAVTDPLTGRAATPGAARVPVEAGARA